VSTIAFGSWRPAATASSNQLPNCFIGLPSIISGVSAASIFLDLRRLGAPRYEVALALENAALAELRARRPDRVLETNVEFWAAHITEQKLTGRLIRPSARYVGPGTRPVSEVAGAAALIQEDR
jgi:hypothetical protein